MPYLKPLTRATSMSKRTISNTTNYASAFDSVSGFLNVPGNWFDKDGTLFRCSFAVKYSTGGSNVTIRYNLTGFGKTLFEDTHTVGASVSNALLDIRCHLSLESLGSLANYRVTQRSIDHANNSAIGYGFADGTCDTTADADLDLNIRFQTADASNVISIYSSVIEEFSV